MDALRSGIIAGLTVWLILYLVEATRNADKAAAVKPDDLISFTTSTTRGEVVKAVLLFGQTAGLKVGSRDEAIGKVVLGENLSLLKNRNGYWLLVYVSDNGNGTTTVEIGIKPKVGRVGSKLPKIRDRAVGSIQAMVMAQSNSTA